MARRSRWIRQDSARRQEPQDIRPDHGHRGAGVQGNTTAMPRAKRSRQRALTGAEPRRSLDRCRLRGRWRAERCAIATEEYPPMPMNLLTAPHADLRTMSFPGRMPMNRLLPSLAIALLVSGCATHRVVEDPAVPAAPLSETTDDGGCDDNVIASYPGTRGRGDSTIRCTREIADIGPLLAKLHPATTLLVLDIDDTLLTSDTFFGSDGWYEWLRQTSTPANAQPLCKFDMIALNYEAATQHAVEGDAGVAFVNGVTAPKLLLTSRSANYRGGTERELVRAAYTLPRNLLAGSDGISWMDDNAALRPPSVPISYFNGIQMVTGRDKGEMLVELLARLKALKRPQKFTDVILVDDGYRNINALHAALPKHGYDYHGYWYKRVVKGPVEGTGDVAEAVDALAQWQTLIADRYPDRWSRWNGKDGCGP
jgi:hypothetical protein